MRYCLSLFNIEEREEQCHLKSFLQLFLIDVTLQISGQISFEESFGDTLSVHTKWLIKIVKN